MLYFRSFVRAHKKRSRRKSLELGLRWQSPTPNTNLDPNLGLVIEVMEAFYFADELGTLDIGQSQNLSLEILKSSKSLDPRL